MKFGIMLGADRAAATIDGVVAAAQMAESAGFSSVWMAHIRALDAISALTVAGTQTSRIELGTAVTPVYPRHPMALAQQAMTAAQASNNRFTLGVGVSHKVVVEGMLGMSYAQPASYMRDYLGALVPLLRGETVTYSGKHFTLNDARIDVPGAQPVPLILAALGPVMLRLAARETGGTYTWMVGPTTLAGHISPALNAAADGAPAPRVIAAFPVLLTNDVAAERQRLAAALEVYGQLPSYRAMLDREGVNNPAELALLGDEQALRERIDAIRAAGVTDFSAAIMASDESGHRRTFDFLASLL